MEPTLKPSHFGQRVSGFYFSGLGSLNRSPSMFKPVIVAFFFVAVATTTSEARHSRIVGQAPGCNVTMPCDFSFRKPGASKPRHMRSATMARAVIVASSGGYGRSRSNHQWASGRLPHSFCGCGASIHVFGHIVPGLNLASNWLRFPRTAPAPGMVAARHGHVFVLKQHVEGDTWMVYDANSGGHATRIHARSLRGYTVVNPHAA